MHSFTFLSAPSAVGIQTPASVLRIPCKVDHRIAESPLPGGTLAMKFPSVSVRYKMLLKLLVGVSFLSQLIYPKHFSHGSKPQFGEASYSHP